MRTLLTLLGDVVRTDRLLRGPPAESIAEQVALTLRADGYAAGRPLDLEDTVVLRLHGQEWQQQCHETEDPKEVARLLLARVQRTLSPGQSKKGIV